MKKRFWPKVKITSGCWLWMGHKTGAEGYGGFQFGKEQRAHRIAWLFTNGPIPRGMEVCHNCDNPACVRPDHLYLGTHAQNMRDVAIRKRQKNSVKGEDHHSSKVTTVDVLEIRSRHAMGGISYVQLSKEFGITPSNIGKIIRRIKWKHV